MPRNEADEVSKAFPKIGEGGPSLMVDEDETECAYRSVADEESKAFPKIGEGGPSLMVDEDETERLYRSVADEVSKAFPLGKVPRNEADEVFLF